MRTLTEEEVQDFITEVQQRPTLWYGKDRLWVRKKHGENEFAVKFVNGLPHGMSTMYVKVLDPHAREAEIERYVSWLLGKFTGYVWRKSVEEFLYKEIHSWQVTGLQEKIERMAREICSVLPVQLQERSEQSAGADLTPIEQKLVVAISPPLQKSRYLQNLLRKK